MIASAVIWYTVIDFVTDVLISFVVQIVFTVGVIFLFGWIISLCNRRFYANFRSHGYAVQCITGCIGTPVHELSHALFCVIFGHKIQEIKLFQINSGDGNLGYVKHSYNRKNLYQNIGNFFIGIAPILVISIILYVIAYFLLPGFGAALYDLTGSIEEVGFVALLENIWAVIVAFFSLITTWQWWVFLLIGLFLALHMTLSKEDIRGAVSGLIFLLIIVLVVDIILRIIGDGVLTTFTSVVVSAGGYLICIMLISLIIDIILLVVSYIVRIFLK